MKQRGGDWSQRREGIRSQIRRERGGVCHETGEEGKRSVGTTAKPPQEQKGRGEGGNSLF